MEHERRLAQVFALDDAAWLRHMNPWSVWTRFAILPLLCVAIWSRVWIGPWCWAPIGVLSVWTWLNPRAFGPPRTANAWSSHAVLGERVWIERKEQPIGDHHAKPLIVTQIVSGLGVPLLAVGLYALEPWVTATGLVMTILGKLWFLDRMVWIWQETPPEQRQRFLPS